MLEGHYASTYLYLLQHDTTPISVVPVAPNLGKRGKPGSKQFLDEEEFQKEHTWLVQKLEAGHGSPVPDSASEHLREGEGVECGCCFTTYPFVSFPGRSASVTLTPLSGRDGSVHGHPLVLYKLCDVLCFHKTGRTELRYSVYGHIWLQDGLPRF